MRRIWMILLLALVLTGCRSIADIKPDTIVDIPLHPTVPPTRESSEPVTEATELPTETEPATEPTEPTQPTTQPPKTNTGSKPSGSKKPSQSSTGKKPTATQPPTEPPTSAPTEPPTEVPTVPPAYDPSGYVPCSLDRAVAEGINARRLAEGLDEFRFDERLCAIASVRARELAQTWHSSRPDGGEGITVLAEYGYGYSVAAENLYYGPGDADAIVDKWMNAKYHRAHILAENMTAIGAGSYTYDGITFVAVLFVG